MRLVRGSLHVRLSLDAGFTLLEVLVALVILGIVLTGLFVGIQSQVDNRYRLQQRYLAQSVAWNRLLEQYQIIEKWAPRSDALGERVGETEVLGQQLYWRLDVRETFGENFYRYETQVYQKPTGEDAAGSLVAYLVVE